MGTMQGLGNRKKAKIVVVGSANTDLIVPVERLPMPGETVLGGQINTSYGGKGANQAVAAARLGAEVTLITRLGRDNHGQECLRAYQEEGIDTSYIRLDDELSTGMAVIMVNPSGENVIAVAPGANGRLSPADVKAAEAVIQQADCLLLQLEIPLDTVLAAAEIAHQAGVRVILDPAPAPSRPLPMELLRNVDILTPNETELAVLSGGSPASDRIKLEVPIMVVTMGARGAYIISGGTIETIPTFPVKAVDSTAAGDAFNGAMAVSLANGESLAYAASYGNAAGALAVTRRGAQSSLPSAEEVRSFLENTTKA